MRFLADTTACGNGVATRRTASRWLDHLAATIRERVVTTLSRNLMSRARPILPEPLLSAQGADENGLSTTKPVRELEPGGSLNAGEAESHFDVHSPRSERSTATPNRKGRRRFICLDRPVEVD